ncbi:hypothetical protein BCR41DRAFT_344506 [Lobosporangium transversale]|uniref:Uncharacterized protein n=1 Tax=Lobosporangium transversale TaxID=64571 RepID=A0A1Y2H3G7_9FUNG|nr:hypothetical protein BCR41DRAFT_344506 [Lobosporangium transversale]ORZ29076.1 hypothetical protein BCR41DRAFT_344506 [Lobosporangium transversale]|eukprot:XP_021886749.1 hypothetical protein BCR41DRAFT_344506 [Lobosporangium transversale]
MLIQGVQTQHHHQNKECPLSRPNYQRRGYIYHLLQDHQDYRLAHQTGPSWCHCRRGRDRPIHAA